MAREERARVAFSPAVEKDIRAVASGTGANSTAKHL